MSDTQATITKGKGTTKHLCGVPSEHCCGSVGITSKSVQWSPKMHNSPPEAKRCYARYLVDVLGYTQVGSREFKPSNGGPIRVLTKESRFGARMRPGKGGRNMPTHRRAGAIVSC
jgi:hypothetical protein